MNLPGLTTDAAGATFSPDRRYRYTLWRQWAKVPGALWICLNPSTAGELDDDPTVRKIIGFSKLFGCGGFMLVNLFALVSTQPAVLRDDPDPVGPENDHRLVIAASHAVHADAPIILAWGAGGTDWRMNTLLLARIAVVLRKLRELPLQCLGRTKGGLPRHPLYLPYSTPLEPFPPPPV